jgi:hypothetical protein
MIKKLGFIPSKVDSCLYTKKTDEGTMVLAVNVDDMLLISPNKRLQKWFETDLGKSLQLLMQQEVHPCQGMVSMVIPC